MDEWHTDRPHRSPSYTRKISIGRNTLRRKNLKTQQSLVILDLCLRKTGSGKSRDYHDAIIRDFENNSR